MRDADVTAGSRFADTTAAARAFELALPMLEPLLAQRDVCGSGFLSIVILDPARGPTDCTFEEAILLERDVGDRSRWDADYAAFARAKARLAWRAHEDGRDVIERAPQLLRRGDSLLAGAVCSDGIVVAVSGAHPHFDEAIAMTLASLLRAIAMGRALDARAAGATSA